MQNTVILIVASYMLLMLLIGWWSSTRIASNEDFMVAGRRLGPLSQNDVQLNKKCLNRHLYVHHKGVFYLAESD